MIISSRFLSTNSIYLGQEYSIPGPLPDIRKLPCRKRPRIATPGKPLGAPHVNTQWTAWTTRQCRRWNVLVRRTEWLARIGTQQSIRRHLRRRHAAKTVGNVSHAGAASAEGLAGQHRLPRVSRRRANQPLRATGGQTFPRKRLATDLGLTPNPRRS